MKFRIRIDLPTKLELELNKKAITRRVGNTLAKRVRTRFLAGRGARGAFPRPSDGGQPLNDTGELIRSIKFSPWLNSVFARGTRANGVRNGKVLAIQMRRNRALASTHPMGVTDELEREAVMVAKEEVAQQLARREARLIAKGRASKANK